MDLIFEWDKNKANANLRKHDVSFDGARTVFEDELLLTFPDDLNLLRRTDLLESDEIRA